MPVRELLYLVRQDLSHRVWPQAQAKQAPLRLPCGHGVKRRGDLGDPQGRLTQHHIKATLGRSRIATMKTVILNVEDGSVITITHPQTSIVTLSSPAASISGELVN